MGWKWDTGRWCRSQLSLVPSLCWRRFDSPTDRKRRRREAQWPRPPPWHPEEWSDLCECPSCRRSLLPPARCTLAAPVLSPAEIEEFSVSKKLDEFPLGFDLTLKLPTRWSKCRIKFLSHPMADLILCGPEANDHFGSPSTRSFAFLKQIYKMPNDFCWTNRKLVRTRYSLRLGEY